MLNCTGERSLRQREPVWHDPVHQPEPTQQQRAAVRNGRHTLSHTRLWWNISVATPTLYLLFSFSLHLKMSSTWGAKITFLCPNGRIFIAFFPIFTRCKISSRVVVWWTLLEHFYITPTILRKHSSVLTSLNLLLQLTHNTFIPATTLHCFCNTPLHHKHCYNTPSTLLQHSYNTGKGRYPIKCYNTATTMVEAGTPPSLLQLRCNTPTTPLLVAGSPP